MRKMFEISLQSYYSIPDGNWLTVMTTGDSRVLRQYQKHNTSITAQLFIDQCSSDQSMSPQVVDIHTPNCSLSIDPKHTAYSALIPRGGLSTSDFYLESTSRNWRGS